MCNTCGFKNETLHLLYWLVIITHTKNKYNRHVIKVDNMSNVLYEDITYSGINMNVCDNGLLVLINEEGKIEMCFDPNNTKIVEDNDFPTYHLADSYDVSGFKSNKLFKISTKSTIK